MAIAYLTAAQKVIFQQTIAQLETNQAELNRKNRQMKNDLFLAHQVQQALLPHEYPTIPPGVDPLQSQVRFCHRYHSADLLRGDFFHIVPLSPGRGGVFICDDNCAIVVACYGKTAAQQFSNMPFFMVAFMGTHA